MKKFDKTTLLTFILIILVIVVIVFNIINVSNKKEKTNEINIVTSYDDFYTVDSCISRTFSYINTKDNKSLLLVIDEKYIKDNNLTEDNVLTIFDNFPQVANFSSKKMYFQKNGVITKFYVYGIIKADSINSNIITGIDYYLIVNLDTENGLFSIEPIDKKTWDGVDNG